MSQIPQKHFPKDRLSQQGKTQTSLHVRATWSRASGGKHRRRRIYKSSPLKWKRWPSTEVGTHGPRPEKWSDFFRFVLRSVSETKKKIL